MKKEKEKRKFEKRNLKEFVPDLQQQTIREQTSLILKNKENSVRTYISFDKPNQLFPEYENFQKTIFNEGFNKEIEYNDPYHNMLHIPNSLIDNKYDVIWLRPKEYIKERMIIDFIKKAFPIGNVNDIRKRLKMENKENEYSDFSEFDRTSVIYNDDRNRNYRKDEDNEKYKELYTKVHNINPNIDGIYVVHSIINEYDIVINPKNSQWNIFEKRNSPIKTLLWTIEREKEIEKEKKPKEKQKAKGGNEELKERVQKRIASPSKLSENFYYSSFSKWMTGIFNALLSMNIGDYNDIRKSLISKIYPQDENNIPVYNPNGKYWVLLYNFGCQRVVEIDDRMPCLEDIPYILPICENENGTENIKEIWPALICKALIKLNSIRFKTEYYDIFNDNSIVYSLTGMIQETISLKETKIYESTLAFLLKQRKFQSKQKLLMVFRKNDDEKKSSLLDKNSIMNPNIYNLNKERPYSYNNINHPHLNPNKEKETVKKRLPSSRLLKTPSNILYNESNQYNKYISCENKENISRRLYNKINDSYPYAITDIFNNKNGEFNMNTLLPQDFSIFKKDKEELMHVNTKTLSKEDKIEHLRKIEKSNLEYKSKREAILSLLNNSMGEEYCLLNINIKNVEEGSSIEKFCSYDIFLARMCMLNNWKYPPLEYLEYKYMRNSHKSLYEFDYLGLISEYNSNNLQKWYEIENQNQIKKGESQERMLKSKSVKNSIFLNLSLINKKLAHKKEKYELYKKPKWTEYYFQYLEKINFNIKEYYSSQVKVPFPKIYRSLDNCWIDFNELFQLFNHFLILHNPDYYDFYLKADYLYDYYNKDVYDINNEIDVIVIFNQSNIEGSFLKELLFPENEKNQKRKEKLNLKKEEEYEKRSKLIKEAYSRLRGDMKNDCYMKYDKVFDENYELCSLSDNYNEYAWSNSKNILDNKRGSFNPNSLSSILIMFEVNYRHEVDFNPINYYVVFDLINQSSHKPLYENIILNSLSNSIQIDNISKSDFYYLYIKGGIFPYGFFLNVYSEMNISKISSYILYKNILDYSAYIYSINKQNINSFRFNLLLKLKIELSSLFQTEKLRNDESFVNFEKKVMFKLFTSLKDNYLKQFIRIDVVEEGEFHVEMNEISGFIGSDSIIPNNNNTSSGFYKKRVSSGYRGNTQGSNQIPYSNSQYFNNNDIEIGVESSRSERRVYLNTEFSITAFPGKVLYLVIGIYPPFNFELPENDFTLLSSASNLNIENIPHMDVFEIKDLYIPNKKKVIFSESIFSFSNVNTTIECNVVNPNQTNSEKDTSIKCRLSIIKSRKVICSYEFFNSILIPNITVDGCLIPVIDMKKEKKPQTQLQTHQSNQSNQTTNIPYQIICSYDYTDSSLDLQKDSFGVFWNWKVYSSGMIAIAKDTSREDFERELKNEWEKKQPGRALQSAKSRKVFQVEEKKEKGVVVLREEEDLIEAEKRRKEKREVKEDEIVNMSTKGKKDKDLNHQRPNTTVGVLVNQRNKYEIDMKKELKLEYKKREYQEYKQEIDSPRKIINENKDLPKILINKVQIQNTIITIDKKDEVYKEYYNQTSKYLDSLREKNLNNLSEIKSTTIKKREKDSIELKDYVLNRNNLQSAIQQKHISDNRLKNIISMSKHKEFDLTWGIELYEKYYLTCSNDLLLKKVKVLLSNKIQKAIEENVFTKKIKDKGVVLKYKGYIEKFRFDENGMIDGFVIKKLNEYL